MNIQVLICKDTCLTVEVYRHHIEPARLMQGTSTDYSSVKSPLSVSVDEEGKEIKSWLDRCMCWCSSIPNNCNSKNFQKVLNLLFKKGTVIVTITLSSKTLPPHTPSPPELN